MISVYVTCKDKQEAKKIARVLLKKKLAGCANIFPIESLYWWEGKIVEDKEYALLIKTLKGKLSRLTKEVKRIHSYSVPCIVATEEKADKGYLEWVKKELK